MTRDVRVEGTATAVTTASARGGEICSTCSPTSIEVLDVRDLDRHLISDIQLRGRGAVSEALFEQRVWQGNEWRAGRATWWQTFDTKPPPSKPSPRGADACRRTMSSWSARRTSRSIATTRGRMPQPFIRRSSDSPRRSRARGGDQVVAVIEAGGAGSGSGVEVRQGWAHCSRCATGSCAGSSPSRPRRRARSRRAERLTAFRRGLTARASAGTLVAWPRAGPAGIVWLRRDLRVRDHPALRAALDAHGRVVPSSASTTGCSHGRHASGPRTQFLLECLGRPRRRAARARVGARDPPRPARARAGRARPRGRRRRRFT